VLHCYGCGADNAKGLRIKSFWDGDEAVCRFKPEPHLCGGRKEIVNGGVVATLIDCHSLNLAVARAYRDVFGVAGEPAALRAHVVAGHRETTRMPSAQTALVALRGLGADIADAVLERARRYYEGSISVSA